MRDYSGVKIGSRFESMNWGVVEVIAIVEQNTHRDKCKVRIRFLNTGNEKEVRYKEVHRGVVKDVDAANSGIQPTTPYKNPRRDVALLPVGSTYKSNFYGMMEVLEYVNSKNITIRFLDTGNVYKVQRDALLKGMIQDLKLKEENTEKRKEEDKNSKSAWEAKLKYWEDLRLAEGARKALIKEEQERQRLEARQTRLANIQAAIEHENREFIGSVFTDRFGYKFTVLYRVGNKKIWRVRYLESGNEYTTKGRYIQDNRLYDSDNEECAKEMKRLRSAEAAEDYERNRERRIEQAKQWQKGNKDKVQIRNQNRRARRVGADGSHTLEETNLLLQDQDHKCACCGEQLTESNRHLDHIMPLVLGGSNYIENLQWLCQFCNNSKGGRHPDDWFAYTQTDSFLARIASRRQ